jgi:hypothetical protein
VIVRKRSEPCSPRVGRWGCGASCGAPRPAGEAPDGGARWQAEDPIAVGFAVTRGAIDLPFAEVTDVWLRSVRFQTEAFFGLDAEIVVVESDRGTIELALGRDDAAPVARRLAKLLIPAT